MAQKRRKKMTEDARLMRSAVAYDRLAAKAMRNGEWRLAEVHSQTANRLKGRALRIRERRERLASGDETRRHAPCDVS